MEDKPEGSLNPRASEELTSSELDLAADESTPAPATAVQTFDADEPDELESFVNVKKLTNLSSWASLLSWIILALFLLNFGSRLYFELPQMLQQPMSVILALNILNLLPTLLIGLFYFLVLQAISEGLNMLMDIEENGLDLLRSLRIKR